MIHDVLAKQLCIFKVMLFDWHLELKKMKVLFLALCLLANAAIAKDIKQDEPGNLSRLGYTEIKISDGIYKIYFGAPRLLFSSKPSWAGWNRRATAVCGESSYNILRKQEYLTGDISQPSGQIFQVEAFVVCKFAGLEDLAAEKIINEYLNPPVVVDEKIIAECTDNKFFNKERAYEEVAKLMSNQKHADALPCLLNMVSSDTEEYINKKAYYELGIMYEMGLGVAIDKEKAAIYYRKSGI